MNPLEGDLPGPELQDKAANLPDEPGVYLFKGARGEILYVGKAKSLRRRVRTYFTTSRDVKTRHLQSRIAELECIVTRSEGEALLLENNLIKQWKPKYNINLKDGKTYPVIKLTAEEYPRVYRTRRILFDGSRYFGPFPQVSQIDLYLNLIDRLFPLRKCRGPVKAKPQPCFYYHIGRCAGVCAGRITREQYAQRVEKVRMLLSGKTEGLLRELREKMAKAAEARAYEAAAGYRDQIAAIQALSEEQKVVDFKTESRDYLGYWIEGSRIRLTVLQMRAGKLVGRDSFLLDNYAPADDFLPQFLGQYYGGRDTLPRTIYLPGERNGSRLDPAAGAEAAAGAGAAGGADGAAAAAGAPAPEIERFLRQLTGSRIAVRVPQRGRHRRLVEMATEGARFTLERETSAPAAGLEALRETLGLASVPRRVEGFDIAHLEGKRTVASLVTFLDGRPHKSGYRHFHIRSLDGRVDDFEAMREAVARRYTRLTNENRQLPDLVLVDGGRGQVGAAVQMLKALDIPQVPVVGLAKRHEELFLPDRSEPLVLPEGSEALRVLQAVRDEAHRFATTFHKRLRAADLGTSVLEALPGIGRKRSRQLLAAFGSVENLLKADPGEVARATGLGFARAQEILALLRSSPSTDPRATG
ncbi:MAG: excinuclease ABC subunit C [Spirochaetales bacterium]|nr:excinuclease ABC subunit C [Spirochaetales bacterium]